MRACNRDPWKARGARFLGNVFNPTPSQAASCLGFRAQVASDGERYDIPMDMSAIVLLSFLIGGGSGDLLDYVPTQMYWQNHGVIVTSDAMRQEAAAQQPPDASALIDQLGAADPRQRGAAGEKIISLGPSVLPQVLQATRLPDAEIALRATGLVERLQNLIPQRNIRRLMAIRTLGELKDRQALPLLRSELDSPDMFAADYAAAAIDAIEGRPHRPRRTTAAREDVWLLPVDCRAVAQLIPRGHGPIVVDQIAAGLPLRPGEDKKATIEHLCKFALDTAEQIGDVRLDALSVGCSGDLTADRGVLVCIATGQYDASLVARVARNSKLPRKTVDGIDVFDLDDDTSLFFPSNRRLVLLASPEAFKLPVAQMIAAVKNNDAALKRSPDMMKRIGAAAPQGDNENRPIWAAAQMTAAYKNVLGIQNLDGFTLTADEWAGKLHVTLHGQSPDAQSADAAALQLGGMAAAAGGFCKLSESVEPALSAATHFFQSAKIHAAGSSVIGTADLEESPAALLMLALDAAY